MLFLYPASPFEKCQPDEDFAEEFEAVVAAGLPTALVAPHDLRPGEFKVMGPALDGQAALYRGWMLTIPEYAALVRATESKGGPVLTSVANYEASHHLPGWYTQLADLTAETEVFAEDTDFAAVLAEKAWDSYFVKDYVKSLSTGRGSLVSSPADIAEVVRLIRHYRGSVEGGVCVRRGEHYLSDTEERFFVSKGRAYGRQGEVPDIVQAVAARLTQPFFSVDVARREDEVLRVVEVGDGQVSDRKAWSLETFVALLKAVATTA